MKSHSTASPAPVAYLVSQYPLISHTFIEREIEGLRALGVPVHTFSVRAPGALLSDAMRAEAERTTVLQDSLPVIAKAGLRELVTHPGATFASAARALGTGEARARSRVWQLFYFSEAVRLLEELNALGVRHIHAGPAAS